MKASSHQTTLHLNVHLIFPRLLLLFSELTNVIKCKSPKISQRPQKPRQEDQLIHRRT